MTPRRPIHLVLISLLFLSLLAGLAAAQTTPAVAQTTPPTLLSIAVDPPVVATGQPTTVILKNFSWDRVAKLDTVLTLRDAIATASADDPVTPSEGQKLGPRRRAALPAELPEAGIWVAEANGTWLFFDPAITSPAAAIVATTGSTTGALTFDSPVEGVVVPLAAGEYGLGAWYFDLTEESSVVLQQRPATGAAPLELTLLDAAGNFLVNEDELILSQTLAAGRYLVAVVAEEQTNYSLTLSTGLSGDSEGGPIEPGTTLPGLIEPADDSDDFTFDGAPGDVVYAAMTANDGLDPYLQIIDPAGNVVAENDDAQGLDSLLSYVVPLAGQYTLRLTSNQGNSSGNYTLEFAHDPEMTRLAPPTRLSVGRQAQGTVPPQGAQAWRLEGAAGQSLGVLVQSLSDGFDAHLTLYGPDGEQLAFSDDDGGNLNPLLNTTLPDDGFYTLVIGSYTGAAGQYSLAVSAEPFPTPTR